MRSPIALLVGLLVLLAFGGGQLARSYSVPRRAPFAHLEPPPVAVSPAPAMADSEGCLHCHAGIEDMHPGFPLSCVDCHGGNGKTREKLLAHVQPSAAPSTDDERVLPLDHDLAYTRFVNPMDLRVAERACGSCHAELVQHLRISLHGTTAGHLSDGFYEVGFTTERGSRFSVFPEAPLTPAEGSTVARLVQLPAIDPKHDPGSLAKGVHAVQPLVRGARGARARRARW